MHWTIHATKGLRRARHYLVALAALNEACQTGDTHLFRVDSDVNVADFFTKGLGGEKHTRFGSQSLGKDINYLYKRRKQTITTDDDHAAQLSVHNEIDQNKGEPSTQNKGEPSTQYKGEPNTQITSKQGELMAREFTQEAYLQKAACYAEKGHEPKLHMFLKLAKFVGHMPRSTVTDNEAKTA